MKTFTDLDRLLGAQPPRIGVLLGRVDVGKSKQQISREHVLAMPVGRECKVRDLRAALPGISDPTFRIALGELKATSASTGPGQGAVWTRTAPSVADTDTEADAA